MRKKNIIFARTKIDENRFLVLLRAWKAFHENNLLKLGEFWNVSAEFVWRLGLLRTARMFHKISRFWNGRSITWFETHVLLENRQIFSSSEIDEKLFKICHFGCRHFKLHATCNWWRYSLVQRTKKEIDAHVLKYQLCWIVTSFSGQSY